MTERTRPREALAEKLSAILSSTHDAIVGSTQLGVIDSWNPAAAELYGYSAEEIIGQNSAVLVPADRRDEEATTIRRVVGGDPVQEYRTARVSKGGSVVAVSLTTSAIVGAVDGSLGLVTVSRGLTATHSSASPNVALNGGGAEAQAAAQPKDSHLQQAQRMEVLGLLAGGIAHDFNNLLAVILNYTAFVSEELSAAADLAPDWAQRKATLRDVGQIKVAAERAAELTQQLLAFARREVVQPRVVELGEVLHRVEELLLRTIGAEIELVVGVPHDPWPIMADPGQIEQILVNLAVNARDAMPAGGRLAIESANVTVDADSVAERSGAVPGRYVRLRVGDTGVGMSEDVVAHAFEPFFTTKSDGTGLGLATVYGIVLQADGTITIQSELGVGTTFTILLPVTEEAAVVIEDPPRYRRSPQGETVLVVEDEPALLEVTERIFTRNGYHVITAANGAEAIDLVAGYESEIHLLVTDVVMPTMLGKEVAERVRKLRPDIEVLFMSGYAQPVLASQGRLEAGVALISKPFSEADLLAKAGLVLNGHFNGFKTVKPETARQ